MPPDPLPLDVPAAKARIKARSVVLRDLQLNFALTGRAGLYNAILNGVELIAIAKEKVGVFDKWLKDAHEEDKDFPRPRWCYSWKRLATVFPSIEDVPPEATSINGALRLAGFLLSGESCAPVKKRRAQFYLRYRVPEGPIEEWAPEELIDWVERLAPIVAQFPAAKALVESRQLLPAAA